MYEMQIMFRFDKTSIEYWDCCCWICYIRYNLSVRIDCDFFCDTASSIFHAIITSSNVIFFVFCLFIWQRSIFLKNWIQYANYKTKYLTSVIHKLLWFSWLFMVLTMNVCEYKVTTRFSENLKVFTPYIRAQCLIICIIFHSKDARKYCHCLMNVIDLLCCRLSDHICVKVIGQAVRLHNVLLQNVHDYFFLLSAAKIQF